MRSGWLPSGVSRGCGGCELGDTVPFRDLILIFLGNEGSWCTISVRRKAEHMVNEEQTEPWGPKLAPCTDGLSSCWAAAASRAAPWAWGQLCQGQEDTEDVISCLPGVLMWKIQQMQKSNTCKSQWTQLAHFNGHLPCAADSSCLTFLGAISPAALWGLCPTEGMGWKGETFVSHLMGRSTAAGLIPASGSSLRFPHSRSRMFLAPKNQAVSGTSLVLHSVSWHFRIKSQVKLNFCTRGVGWFLVRYAQASSPQKVHGEAGLPLCFTVVQQVWKQLLNPSAPFFFPFAYHIHHSKVINS